ncbi:Phosphoglycerate mutase [Caenispirillum salinarum AK4]|uniref:Phosphoglycerate mutase n=1 Tax=Caenispirillum salinarum AK4 TaxID=1238182 RepID=K9H4S4_9PROT|nr:histidine phosphatase family protein [Caenispirillum salinarum]EKV32562.1 Phosphoglycerate mutase [Caenispirillum salinarum AK4]
MEGATRFWWVRHAPVDAAPGEIVGVLDRPCRAMDAAAVSALRHVLPPDAAAVTSGLARCRATADALGFSQAVTEPGLREQDFGAWQGRTWADLPFSETGDFWEAPATARPPGGESFADQVARVRACIERLAEARAGHDVVAVVHAGTIRAALALAMGLEADPAPALCFGVEPLSLTRVDLVAEGAAVHLVNWRPRP